MSELLELEIAVQDHRGAAIARKAGASRVEVCAALGLTGGLTPSPGALSLILAEKIPAHVLVRPRPGSFVYSDQEIAVMVKDIEMSLEAGAAGVVIGALTKDGLLDTSAIKQLVAAARNRANALGRSCDITFHRALDVTPDPVEALKTLAGLGVDRVLTSGGARRSFDGMTMLGALVAANTGVQIMAGGGVSASDISHLAQVGVHSVHLSAREQVRDIGLVGPGGGVPGDLDVTSPEIVAAAAEEVRLVNRAKKR